MISSGLIMYSASKWSLGFNLPTNSSGVVTTLPLTFFSNRIETEFRIVLSNRSELKAWYRKSKSYLSSSL